VCDGEPNRYARIAPLSDLIIAPLWTVMPFIALLPLRT
jgi:hypothetical protein